MRILRLLSALLCLAAAGAAAAEGDLWTKQANSFLEEHCLDCHEPGTTKGGLDLTKAEMTMGSAAQVALWTHVFDRISRGEMPPKKKAPLSAAEVKGILASLEPRLLEADRAQRKVILRRLNRVEYQNTIRDLLGVEMRVTELLPEDQKLGGFDNNGGALAVSTEQMQGYLKAAGMAVDTVLTIGKQPVPETKTISMCGDVEKTIEKYSFEGGFGIVEGKVAIFKTDTGTYSQVATRAERMKTGGKYRFRFQAQSLNCDSTVFTVTVQDYGAGGQGDRNLGYFEATPERKTFELEVEVAKGGTLQFFGIGLPHGLKRDDQPHPGVAFGVVEMTGPLCPEWPPARFTTLLNGCDPATAGAAEARAIFETFLPRAFRRPVTPEEVERYLKLTTAQLDEKRHFLEALRTGLIGALCSPNFLYLREATQPGQRRISPVELASRVSYMLWSSMPDAELLRVAGDGTLAQSKVLHAQVERMLADPKGDAFVKNFCGQWLHLREINDTQPDAKLYPKFDELLQASLVWESEGFFRQLLREDLPVSNFLDSKFAMLNARLAQHYGIAGVKGLEVHKVELPPDDVRGGVLTQGAVLKVTANGTNTSPVLRGVWVLENILGQAVPPPPPNTGGIEPDIRGATTIREQLAKHRNNESCNVCHRNIDPPGFALESFDPTGALREKYRRFIVTNPEKGYGRAEDGSPVDATGELADGTPFTGIRDFKQLLMKQQAAFAETLTRKLLTYGLGREPGFSDRKPIAAITAANARQGGGLRSLVHQIVESDIFATR